MVKAENPRTDIDLQLIMAHPGDAALLVEPLGNSDAILEPFGNRWTADALLDEIWPETTISQHSQLFYLRSEGWSSPSWQPPAKSMFDALPYCLIRSICDNIENGETLVTFLKAFKESDCFGDLAMILDLVDECSFTPENVWPILKVSDTELKTYRNEIAFALHFYTRRGVELRFAQSHRIKKQTPDDSESDCSSSGSEVSNEVEFPLIKQYFKC